MHKHFHLTAVAVTQRLRVPSQNVDGDPTWCTVPHVGPVIRSETHFTIMAQMDNYLVTRERERGVDVSD